MGIESAALVDIAKTIKSHGKDTIGKLRKSPYLLDHVAANIMREGIKADKNLSTASNGKLDKSGILVTLTDLNNPKRVEELDEILAETEQPTSEDSLNGQLYMAQKMGFLKPQGVLGTDFTLIHPELPLIAEVRVESEGRTGFDHLLRVNQLQIRYHPNQLFQRAA